MATVPGGPGFALTVNGTGFAPGSVVNWNGSARPTTFVRSTQLTAAIPAADIATASTAWITVVNPAPGGGTSNVAFLAITSPRPTVSFVIFRAGSGGLLTADFNGDRKLDLVYLSPGFLISAAVSSFLGNGDGTFRFISSFNISGTVGSMNTGSVGDFNGDGKLDIAVSFGGRFGSGVTILFGNGDGTFRIGSGPTFTATSSPAVVADFNGDGQLDFAVATGGVTTPSFLSICLGNGDGTFQPVVNYLLPFLVTAVTVGDFNGDGKPDLAVAGGGFVSVFLGNGDGTFQPRLDFAVTPSVLSIVTADFNGDGKLDLAVSSEGLTSSTVSVLLGNGDGTFQPAVSFPVNQRPSNLARLLLLVGDFNGDGKLDLVISSPGGTTSSIFLGNGDGTFQTPLDFYSEGTIAAVGDFNNDGKPDLAGDRVYLQITGFALSPLRLDLGTQPVGTTSPPQSFTIINNNAAGLGISSITLTGLNSTEFSQTNNCPLSPATLAPGSSCSVNVTFTPATPNRSSAQINITNSSSGPPQTLLLGGLGIIPAPQVTVFPPILTFTGQAVGTSSPAQNITVTSTGNVALNISRIFLAGSNVPDFRLVPATTTCPLSGGQLAAGANCVISVSFAPTSAGAKDAQVSILDDAPGSQQIVSLTGTGNGPGVMLSRISLSFAAQNVGTTSAAQSFTLTSSGSAPLNITSIAITGTNSGDFALASGTTCPQTGGTLAVGANCTLSITFTPSGTGGRSAAVTITDNAGGSPHTVSLTGTGAQPGPAVSLSPASLSFSGQNVGTTSSAQSVTLSNTGTAPLTIASLNPSGDFALTSTCGTSVAPRASCAINVTFTPTTGGTRTGSITISDNAPGSPQTVALSGTGMDFTLTTSASSATVTAGQPANFQMTLAPASGFSGNVALTCTGAPPAGSCTPSPSSVMLNGSAPVTATFIVTTTVRSVVPPGNQPPRMPPIPLGPLRILVLTGTLAWALLRSASRASRRRLWLGTAMAIALAGICIGCGAAGGGGRKPAPTAGTPPGTYNIMMTATSGNLSHTTTVTLTVN